MTNRAMVERRASSLRHATVWRDRVRVAGPRWRPGRAFGRTSAQLFAYAEPLYDASAPRALRWPRTFYAAGADVALGRLTAEAYYLRLDEHAVGPAPATRRDRDVVGLVLIARPWR